LGTAKSDNRLIFNDCRAFLFIMLLRKKRSGVAIVDGFA